MNNHNNNAPDSQDKIKSLQARIAELDKSQSHYRDIEEKLRESRAELEIRVKVRTAELAKLNEDLRREISERKKIEGALRESEEKFRTIADFTYDWEYWQSNDGKMMHVSPSCQRVCGYKPADFAANQNLLIEMIHPGDQKRVKAAVEDAVRENKPLEIEFRIMRRDGVVRWMHHVCQPVFDGSGHATGRRASNRDITDKNNAEELLAVQERFLASVFLSIQDGISILDKDLNILRVNSTMEKWYSHAMPVVGRKCYQAYHSSKTPCKVCPTRKTLDTKSAAYEVVPKRGDKGEITGWLDLYSFPLFDTKTGEMTGVIEYVRDISERKEAEEALRESENKLKTILSSMADMVFGFDSAKRFVFCHSSAGGQNMYLPQESFIGKRHSDVMPAQVDELFNKAFAKNKRNEVSGFEYSLKFGEEEKWFSAKLSPIFIDNSFGGCVAVVRDITDYKRAEDDRVRLNKDLAAANKRLKELSLTDALTGLYNQRFLAEIFEAEFYRAKRCASPLAFIMLDVDYFRSVNELYGRQFGDIVLKQVAKLLKKMVRKYDTVVRFSAEEFAVVSAGADRTAALNLAHRILNRINLSNFGSVKNKIKLKVSLAAVSYPEDKAIKGADLVNLADKIMNKAKDSGGNRVFSVLDIKKKAAVEESDETPYTRILKAKIDRLNHRANQSLAESIFAFAKTIELRDRYTGEHVENTVHYAAEIAKRLHFSKEEIELIKQSAILHDLGKVGISDKILLKKSKLTPAEFEKIKKHPQIGADILRPIRFLSSIIPVIFYHHERWDGKGYPSGLKGDDIPIGARIIAIADVYQALISNRPYRRAYSKEQALKIIRKASGSQFDPQIVSAFLDLLKEGK